MGEGAPEGPTGQDGGLPLLLAAIVMGAVLWGAVATGLGVLDSPEGRDFATYAYAAEAAWSGADPYDTAAIAAAAVEDGARYVVHPFVYPPSFLLFAGWIPAIGLSVAYPLWAGISALALVGVAVGLGRRPWSGGAGGPWIAALAVAVGSVAWDNLLMGQVNAVILLLVIGGVGLLPEGSPGSPGETGWMRARPWLAGGLLGLAIALKGPAVLVVGWLLLRRRWPAVLTAGLVTAGLLAASATVFGPGVLSTFAGRILPGLADGTANGLQIPIDLVANHSPASVLHGWFPHAGPGLSPIARAATSGLRLGVLGLLVAALWRPPADPLARGGQLAAVLAAALLLPVYTFEHHLLLALPAVVVTITAGLRGRLPRWALAGVGLAVAVWAVDIAWVLRIGQALPGWLAPMAAEAKLAAVVVLAVASAWVGRSTVSSRDPR